MSQAEILAVLPDNEAEALSVQDIALAVGVGQSTTSECLRTLLRCGEVAYRERRLRPKGKPNRHWWRTEGRR